MRFLLSAMRLLLIVSLFVPVRSDAASYDTIQVSNPFLNKTPVALPAFMPLTGSPGETALGGEALEILKNGLEFTGYLKQISPNAFLANPAETGIQMSQINFQDWTGIGAELLITGGIEEKNGRVKLELRLFDTFNTQLLKGKIYTGPPSQIRRMIHLFCAEVSYALTGKWGVFASKLAFVSTVDGNKEIFVSDFDGYNPVRFTRHKSISLSPAWSSNGQWLAYVSYAGGKPDIYIRHQEQNRGGTIGPGRHEYHTGLDAWAGNAGRSLEFSGNQEIYLLTRQGEMIKKVTSSWGINVSPEFSPDGGKLAFVSNRSGNPQIYIKDLSSGNVSRVTFQGKYNTSPAWSPDGKKIVYVGIENNRIDIYLILLDTGPGMPVQLTRDQGDNEDPCWSPDGNLIVFSSTRDGQGPALFVMTAAGTDQRRLMKMPGRQTQPRWSGPITYREQ